MGLVQKRKYVRVSCDNPCTAKIALQTRLKDISIYGCFLETEMTVPEGTRIELEFALPTSPKIIKVICEVRWCGEYSSDSKIDQVRGIGLKFLDMDHDNIPIIGEYVKTFSSPTRKHPRRKENLKVVYVRGGDDAISTARATDLSLGGMFIKTESQCQVGDIIRLECFLPAGDPLIKCNGRVAYVNSAIPPMFQQMILPGMGVEFMEVSGQDQKKLRDYLHR